MARKQRIEYAGAYYHVMARGDRREPIVRSDGDRRDFVETMGRACTRAGWRMHAWVLMGNHYHWLIETPEGNLVDGMRWFQNTYTRRFNVRNGLWGHVFGDRYKAVIVEPEERSGDYFTALLDYIHLNPVRAGMVDAGMGLLACRWSSLSAAYAVAASKRPEWMEAGAGLNLLQCADSVSGRRRFVERLEERARTEGTEAGHTRLEGQTLQSTLRRGWYWGSEALKEKLLGRGDAGSVRQRSRHQRLSAQGRDETLDAAERLLREALKAVDLRLEELAKLPGSDQRKVEIAAALRENTTVSLAWIAARLCMRSPGNVSQQLSRRNKGEWKPEGEL